MQLKSLLNVASQKIVMDWMKIQMTMASGSARNKAGLVIFQNSQDMEPPNFEFRPPSDLAG